MAGPYRTQAEVLGDVVLVCGGDDDYELPPVVSAAVPEAAPNPVKAYQVAAASAGLGLLVLLGMLAFMQPHQARSVVHYVDAELVPVR